MMALDVNDIMSMASLRFSEKVVDILKKAKFCMNDIYNLTRDDVDQEFKEFRFGIRKSLWIFFESVRQQNIENKQVDEEEMLPFGESENHFRIHEQISSQPASTSKIVTSPSSGSDSGTLKTLFSQVGMEETVADETEQAVMQNKDIIEHVPQEIKVPSDQYESNADDDERQISKVITPIRKSERKSRRSRMTESTPKIGLPFKRSGVSQNTVEITPCHQDSNVGDDKRQTTKSVMPIPKVKRKRKRTNFELDSSGKKFLPFQGRPGEWMKVLETMPCYPEGVTYPFPFTPEIKNFLSNCEDIGATEKGAEYIGAAERGTEYLDFVKEIYFITEISAVKEPTLDDWRAVCQGLCWEYPNLLLNGAAERVYLEVQRKANFHLKYVRETEQYVLDNGSAETKMKKSTLFKPVDYPSDVPFPFPLSAVHKKILSCGMKLLKNGERLQAACHNAVAREVCWSLHRYMPEGSPKCVRDAVAESFCAQYPALYEESPSKHLWSQFAHTMRKRLNNSSRYRRINCLTNGDDKNMDLSDQT